MGTLYECLKEAKLERYYPSFRSHGITKSEALTRLTVSDCQTFGITSAEDKRRLVELISIVKAVHNTERDNVLSGPPPSNRSVMNVKSKSARKRNRSPVTYSPLQVGGRPLAATNDVKVRDRSSRPSASSHHLSGAGAAILDLISDTESSEETSTADSEEHSDYEPAVKHSVTASVRELPASRGRKTPVEKVKHGAGYNYGVPGGSGGTRPKSRPGSGRLNVDRIKVCVRKRPLSKREARGGEEDMVRAASTTTLVVSEPKQAVDLTAYTLQHEFIFDEVFEESCSNEDVYIRAARPLISCVFDGGSATCFAYGQTGAGKTHTMIGNAEIPGLYLLAAHDIFSLIETGQYGDGIKVWVSFFEIYCGQLFDLLNKRNRLHAREDGSHRVCIAGLTETEALDEQSLMQVLDYGNSVRSKGVSGVNPDSSRSHAVLQMEIRDSADRRLGRISFIDLAGSERASDSGDTDRQTRMEGAEINQSLLALKECIRSIDQSSRHKPFRQSKLTHILKDSFMGNSRTCMIANISPGSLSCEHTLNTLRYADRVKELRKNSGQSASSSTRNSTNVAMSNILMNIPAATAPSIFQPSNILCSSTPMRQSSRQLTNRNSSNDIHLDPSETPIRGPGAKRKTSSAAGRSEQRVSTSSSSSSRNTAAHRHAGPTRVTSSISSRAEIPPASVSKSTNRMPVTRHVASTPNVTANMPVTNNGNRQNFSSNSESDQTDTDSNNAIGSQRPTLLANQLAHIEHKSFNNKAGNINRKLPVSASQNIPVIRSSDTDNDFPTTDFNNEEEMNDLNRTGGKNNVAASTPVFPSGLSNKLHTPATAASQPRSDHVLSIDSQSSGTRMSSVSASVPVLQKKVYAESQGNRGNSQPQTETGHTRSDPPQSAATVTPNYGGGETYTRQYSAHDSGVKPSVSPSPKTKDIEKPHQPVVQTEFKRPLRLACTLSSEFDDDLLFDAPSLDQRNWTPRTPSENSGTQPRVPQNPSLQPEIPAVLPAKSTELASFSQSPRWNLNKNHNNHVQHQHHTQQGFRPEPVRSHPKPAPSNGHITGNETKHRQMPAEKYTSSRSSHIVPKQKQNSMYIDGNDSGNSRPTGGQTTGTKDRSHGVPQHREQARLDRDSKEPLSANWFDTPADLETHLAKSASDRRVNNSGDHSERDRDSLRSGSDKDSIRSDDTSMKRLEDEGTHAHRKASRSARSEYSDSGRGTATPDTSDKKLSKTEKDKANYQNSDYSKPGYFSDSGPRSNAFLTSRSRVVHSPVTVRQAYNTSPVIKDYVSHSPVPGDPATRSDSPRTASKAYSDTAVTSASSSKSNGALKTEKLTTGACFSPIHPQPVTSNKQVKTAAALSKDIVHPTPVSQPSTPRDQTDSTHSSHTSDNETIDLKSQLIGSHEDQLATVTSLCKQEMKLLLGAKAGNKSFSSYMQKVSDVLSQKMSAIQLLQDQIIAYQLSTQDSS